MAEGEAIGKFRSGDIGEVGRAVAGARQGYYRGGGTRLRVATSTSAALFAANLFASDAALAAASFSSIRRRLSFNISSSRRKLRYSQTSSESESLFGMVNNKRTS